MKTVPLTALANDSCLRPRGGGTPSSRFLSGRLRRDTLIVCVEEVRAKDRLAATSEVVILPSLRVLPLQPANVSNEMKAEADSVTAEMVLRGRCSRVAPCGDARALAEAIRELADKRETRLAMGHRGRDAFERYFERTACVEACERLLGRVE